MRIVAFAGKSQSGKTTSALHAISVFGGTKIALADAVKEEVAEFLTQCSRRLIFGGRGRRGRTK